MGIPVISRALIGSCQSALNGPHDKLEHGPNIWRTLFSYFVSSVETFLNETACIGRFRQF